MKKENVIRDKSYAFAVRIVRLAQFLVNDKREFVLSKQILKSGTAIGALVRESEYGESKKDFVHKLALALKEANETDYWICLLRDTGFLNKKEFESLGEDCIELIKILTAIIKSSKSESYFSKQF